MYKYPSSLAAYWNNEMCVFCTDPQISQQDSVPVASGSNLLGKVTHGHVPFSVSLPHSPASVSWDHLPQKLLTLQSFS